MKLFIRIFFLFQISFLFAQKPELVLPLGNTDKITSVAYSPNGKYIASGDCDNKAIIWDAETGAEIKRLACHKNHVTCLAFTADSKYLITCDKNGKIYKTDIVTGDTIKSFGGFKSAITSISVSTDGNFFVAGGWDKYAMVYSTNGNSKTGPFILNDTINDVKFLPKDEKIAVACKDSCIYILSLMQTAFPMYKIVMNEKRVRSIDVRDSLLVCGSAVNQALFLMNLKKLKGVFDDTKITATKTVSAEEIQIAAFKIPKGGIWKVMFSPDGKKIAAAGDSKSKTAYIWSLVKNSKGTYGTQPVDSLKGHSDEIHTISFSPAGSNIVTGSYDKTMIIWELSQKKAEKKCILKAHTGVVNAIDWSEDAKYILAGFMTNHAKLLSIDQGLISNLVGHKGYVENFSFSPNSKYIITGSNDSTLKLWNINNIVFSEFTKQTSAKAVYTYPPGKKTDKYYSYIYSKSGDSVLFCNQNKVMSLWTLANSKIIRTDSIIVPYTLIDFNFKLNKIVYTKQGNEIFYVENKMFDDAMLLTSKDSIIDNLLLSPDEKYIISISHNKTLKNRKQANCIDIWRISDLTHLPLSEKIGSINFFSYLPDKNQIITADTSGKITVWDLSTGQKTKTFTGHSDKINSVCLSEENGMMLTGSSDAKINIWNYELEKLLGTLVFIDSIDWVVTTPEGYYYATNNARKQMHYTVGAEIIELEQLKYKYFIPNLLPRILAKEVFPPLNFDNIKLFPEIMKPVMVDDSLIFDLILRDGGFGKVEVKVNSKAISTKTLINKRKGKDTLQCKINLVKYLRSGKTNEITIRTSNNEGNLMSGIHTIKYEKKGIEPTEKDIQCFIVSCGISNYDQKKIKLYYADKDATEIAYNLELAASKYFEKKPIVYKLTTSGKDLPPTKENILNTLAEVNKLAKPTDLLIVYLSGHGINLSGPDGDFYYLTKEATSNDADDYYFKTLRDKYCLSGDTIISILNEIAAGKQFLIIDACHSGKIIEDTATSKSLDYNTQKILETMMDKTGTYILTGSGKDQKSYEDKIYGHGLLTQGIIESLAQNNENCINVSKLIDDAIDKTYHISIELNKPQKPLKYFDREAEPFCIGRISGLNSNEIIISLPKPVCLPSEFQNEKEYVDNIGVSEKLNKVLKSCSDSLPDASFVFWDKKVRIKNTYSIVGRYLVNRSEIKLKGYFCIENIPIQEFSYEFIEIKDMAKQLQTITEDFSKFVKEASRKNEK